MAKWIPTLMAILAGVLPILSVPLQHFVGAHPTAAGLTVAIGGAVLHMLDSPVSDSMGK